MIDLGNYDAQKELTQTLINDDKLQQLINERFYNRVAEQDAEFPRVVYTQIEDANTKYADDEEIEATVYFQISIFTDAETVMHETEIYKEIDRIMKSINYKRYDYQGLYETDTKLHHLALRYQKQF